ncbi:MAG: polysaccharide pyruvyl transferase CsaB [Candidatus Eremiobacterota bacterium]
MRKNDILLSGYYGFKNTGDEAILASILDALKKVEPELKVKILSVNPSFTEKEYSTPSVHRYRPEMFYALMESRMLISGGGGLLQDSTSIRSPLYYLAMVLLAKLAGKKVMFYAQGIGPLNTFAGKYLTSFIANMVDFITVRDEKSAQILKELGVCKPTIEVTTDPVFAMKPAIEHDILNAFTSENIPFEGNRWIGVSVRDWNSSVDYLNIISHVVDRLSEKFSCKVLFIPMHYPDDLIISGKIKNMMKSSAYIVCSEYSPRVLMGILGKMNIIIAMRLHAVIMSSVLGVPSLPLAYDPKITNISEQLGLKYLALEEINEDNLYDMALKLAENHEKISSLLTGKTEILKVKALRNAEIAKEILRKP